jgi:hypothetical protein
VRANSSLRQKIAADVGDTRSACINKVII